MAGLLPTGGWVDRKAKELSVLEPEEGKFVYIGCCVELEGEDINEMVDGDEWESKEGRKDCAEQLTEIREKCSNVDIWADIMGYARTPDDGLLLEYDWSITYGKGKYKGMECYWICHSRIEYIWVDFGLKVVGIQTGRMSCSGSNLSNTPKSDLTPAEKVKLRANAKKEKKN